MYRYILVLCGMAFASDYDEIGLQWPEKYAARGMKINLKANLEQDFQFWKSEDSSRMDYNQGATKIFRYDSTVEGDEYGTEYRIHPKTTEEQQNELVCTHVVGTEEEDKTPKSILPDAYDFEFIGTEAVLDKEVTKFHSDRIDTDLETHTRESVWASYDNETSDWIPLRYEKQIFSTWYGNSQHHTIWIFYNFEQDFNSVSVNYTEFPACQTKFPHRINNGAHRIAAPSIFLNPDREEDVIDSFNKHLQKQYEWREKKHQIKKNIFKENLNLVQSSNRQDLGYKLALNKLADLTPGEMKNRMGLRRSANQEKGSIPFPYTLAQIKEQCTDLPQEYDLRLMGWVTPVKDQVDCGCSWAIGATAAVEGALARSNGGRLLSLSNQALIDCSWGFGSEGCDGGSDTAAYEWMIKYGLPSVEEYGAYSATEGYCEIDNMTNLYPIRGYTKVTPYSIEGLKWALINHGPVTVSVHVTPALILYSNGIFYDPSCNSTAVDHVMTLVGYGNQDRDEFWILKNSWGVDWGIDGYMHISTRDNNCGVATKPTYVVF